MIEIKLDLNLLRQLIEENSVDLDILGGPYKQRVINARLLLEVIHRAVDVDKNTFIDYINVMSSNFYVEKDRYKRISEIDVLFKNIRHEGAFHSKGHEALKGDPFIFHHIISYLK